VFISLVTNGLINQMYNFTSNMTGRLTHTFLFKFHKVKSKKTIGEKCEEI